MNPFQDHQLCEGGYCEEKSTCARYMGNIDLTGRFNPQIVFVKEPCPWGLCPYWLEIPDKNYPAKHGCAD